MSSFDASMEPMLDMFIFETTTLLEQLDEILLSSEKAKKFSEENINEIFRIMHTIKGSAAMMGIDSIATLAHRVEDMFFFIRENPSKLDNNSEIIFNCVFSASDYFKTEIDCIQSGDYVPASSADLVVQFESLIKTLKGDPSKPAKQTNKSQSIEDIQRQNDLALDIADMNEITFLDDEIHKVTVHFEDGCQMENIRAFMLLTQLKDCCEIISSNPPEPEKNSDCAGYIIKNGLSIKFRAANPQDVLDVIEAAINIKSYEVIEDDEEIFAEPNEEPEAISGINNKVDTVVKSAVAVVENNQPMKSGGKQSLISVNQLKLDQLMEIVGEIVIAESMVISNPEIKGLTLDSFYKATRQLRKLTDELQDVVMSIRMVPLSGTLQKMARLVRDMGKKLGKEAELVTVGGDTEVDKAINDVIGDPFMHMVRNAMDHAIESTSERIAAGKTPVGKITIAAQNVGGEIVITISDDGKGLKTDRILKKARENGLLTRNENEYTEKEIYGLIMLAGFSTKEKVTEFSGRGVGMDVVRKNIEKVGGSISVESKEGVGTTFTIKIPLTLAIVDGMEISVGNTVFTIPITSIKQSFKISEDTKVLYDTDNTEMIMVRGECYPIIRLHEIYNIPTKCEKLEDGIVILVENESKVACLFADELIGEQPVVVKPFPSFLAKYDIKGKGLAGCTILGDGSISLILDANNLLSTY